MTTYICNLIQKLLKALNIELVPLFPSMSKAFLFAFQANSENIKCLRVFAFACSILGKQPAVLQTIASSYDELCMIIMTKVYEQKNNQV